MKPITFFISLIILLTSCTYSNSPIHDGGHSSIEQRNLLPEPDLALRLQSEYFDLSNKMIHNELKKEEYIVSKKFNDGTSETDITIGRNENNQVVVLEEYILDRYADKTHEIIQSYYIDIFGKVFAIEQQTNSMCQEFDSHQIIVKYYNPDFKLIKTTSEIKDTEGQNLDKSKCGSEFDETLGIESNYKSILETYAHVKEKNNYTQQ